MASKEGGFVKWIGGITATVIAGVVVAVLTGTDPSGVPGPSTIGPTAPPASVGSGSGSGSDVNADTDDPVDFALTDQLGPGQISERITVVVNGRMVGTLTVDAIHTSAELVVTVPESGTYSYELQGSIVVQDDLGNAYQLTGTGTGTIDVVQGRRFTLVGDYSGDPVVMELR
jgi:hypothetical protein